MILKEVLMLIHALMKSRKKEKYEVTDADLVQKEIERLIKKALTLSGRASRLECQTTQSFSHTVCPSGMRAWSEV